MKISNVLIKLNQIPNQLLGAPRKKNSLCLYTARNNSNIRNKLYFLRNIIHYNRMKEEYFYYLIKTNQ